MLVPGRTERTTLLNRIGAVEWCNEGLEGCHLEVRGQEWTVEDQTIREIKEGDLVRVTTRNSATCSNDKTANRRHSNRSTEPHTTMDRGDDREMDEVQMMQRPSHGTLEAWFYLYQEGTEEPYAEKLTEDEAKAPKKELDKRLRARNQEWRANPGRLFQVSPNPPDLTRFGIHAIIQADPQKLQGDHSIIMVDVEIHSDWTGRDPTARPGDEWREVLYTPTVLTRDDFIAKLEIQHLCSQSNTDCEITQDEDSWPNSDREARFLKHGEYILVRITSTKESCPRLQEAPHGKDHTGENETEHWELEEDPESDSQGLLQLQADALVATWMATHTFASAPMPLQPPHLPEQEGTTPTDDNINTQFAEVYNDLASATMLILLRRHEGFRLNDRFEIMDPGTMTPNVLLESILEAWPNLRNQEWTLTLVSDQMLMSTSDNTKTVLIHTGREEQQNPTVTIEIGWEFSQDYMQVRLLAMEWEDVTSKSRVITYLDADEECREQVRCYVFHQGDPLQQEQMTHIQNGDIIQVIMLRENPEHPAHMRSGALGHLWDSTTLRLLQVLIRSQGISRIYQDTSPNTEEQQESIAFPTSQATTWKALKHHVRQRWTRFSDHTIWNIYKVHGAWKKEINSQEVNEMFLIDEKYQSPVREAITLMIYIVVYDAEGDTMTTLFAKRMQSFHTKNGLLDRLKMQQECNRKECEVLCNGRTMETRTLDSKSGDFCVVHVKPREHQRQCRERSRSLQREKAHTQKSEGTSLIQTHKGRTNTKSTTTAATHARQRIPPPGNGTGKKVSFDEVIEVHEDYLTTQVRDRKIQNQYLQGLVTSLGDTDNPFLIAVAKELGWEKCNEPAKGPEFEVKAQAPNTWSSLQEVTNDEGFDTVWTPSGPQHFGYKGRDQLRQAGYKVFALPFGDQVLHAIGDNNSFVLPTIFHGNETYVRYCAYGSWAEEVVTLYNPGYKPIQNVCITQPGQIIQISHPYKVPLELQTLIPEPPTTILDCLKVADLYDALVDPILPACIPEYPIEWHEATKEARQYVLDWKGHQHTCPIRYDFYMDGTATRGTMGAGAVVAIATENGQQYWIGARGGECRETTTSNRMEASAMTVALLWAHSLTTWHTQRRTTISLGFHYDSQITGNITSGIWTPRTNLDLHIANRALAQWLQERPGVDWTDWTHVPAHKGHPWNEAVDTVATAIATGLIRAPPLHCFTSQIGQGKEREWLWYWERHRWDPRIRFTTTGPKLVIRHELEPRQSNSVHDIQEYIQKHKESEEMTDTPNHEFANIYIGTANVLSLFPHRQDGRSGHGRYISARMESLLQQLSEEDYHIIGLQETRSRLMGHQEVHGYHILSHASTEKGHGGVQLWIKNRWILKDHNIQIQIHNMHIIYGDPQTLIVKMQKGSLKIIFAVLHAPQSNELKEYESYWQNISSKMPKELQRWPLIVMADANARLGPRESEGIGHISEDQEGPTAPLQQGLCIPSTFECHSGPTYTWTHSDGKHRARLDYIMVPHSMLPQVQNSWVDQRVDLSIRRRDHEMTAIELKWRIEMQENKKIKTPKKIPAKSFRDSLPDLIQKGYRKEIATCLNLQSNEGNVHQQAHELARGAQQLQEWYATSTRLQRDWHLTEETWQLVCEKKNLWQQMRYMKHQCKMLWCSAVWKGWREAIGKPAAYQPAHKWRKQMDHQMAMHQNSYRNLSQRTVEALRKDDTNYYKRLSYKAKDVEGTAGSLWKYVKPMLTKNMEKRANNTRCRGPTNAQLHAHFDQLEAAQATSYEALLAQCQEAQRRAGQDSPSFCQLTELPTKFEIEVLCRRTNPDKAPGIDQVSGGIFKYGADVISDPLHTIFTHSWLSGAEPLQWKGGILVPIWKRKGHPSQAEMYRGITLLDNAAKRWHAFLRQRLLMEVAPQRPIGQLGGFPHQQTGFASLYLRSLAEATRKHNAPEAYLFVDLVGAFHYLVREAAFQVENENNQCLQQALQQDGLDLDTLRSQAQHPIHQKTWDSLPVLLRRALRDAHNHTWTSMNTSDGSFSRTYRGTRPGSPIADLAFNYYLGHILRDLQECMDSDETIQQLSREIGIPLRAIAWVDDLVIPLASTNNTTLMDMVTEYTRLVQLVMHKHGFLVNFSKGKTEAVVTFRRKDAPGWRESIFVDNQGQCEIPPQPGQSAISLHIVPRYKHLGAIHGHHSDFREEIKSRLHDAQKTYKSLGKILHNPHLEIHCRLQLFEALVMSKLFFNSGYWPRLRCEDATKLNDQVIQWQRKITKEGDAQITPDAVLTTWTWSSAWTQSRPSGLPSSGKFWCTCMAGCSYSWEW